METKTMDMGIQGNDQLGQGDPVHAAETSVVYLFKFAIKQQKLGYGSMIAIALFLVCLAFSLFYQKVLVKND